MRKSRCCLPPWQPGPVDCLRLEDRSRCDTTSNRARGKDQAGNSPHELPMEGQASYRSVVVDGKVNLDAAWLYPTPLAAAGHIQGRVAFWRGVTIEDSERAPRRTLRDLLRHAKSSPRVADSGHVSPVVDLDTAGFAASTSGQADKRTSGQADKRTSGQADKRRSSTSGHRGVRRAKHSIRASKERLSNTPATSCGSHR